MRIPRSVIRRLSSDGKPPPQDGIDERDGSPMKKQKILAALTAFMTLFTCFVMPIHATEGLTLTLTDNVAEGETVALGDTVTYTVSITANEGGFCAGTFCFLPTENLQYESATLLAEDAEAKRMDDENEGAYGIKYLQTANMTATDTVLCTMTFRVIGLGDASVRFYSYQLINTDLDPVSAQIDSDTLTHTVAAPDKPSVVTENLKDGVMGKTYTAVLESDFHAEIPSDDLSWELTDGDLPAGLELLNDGTLTGTPTEFGTFTFSVTFSLFDSIVSDEKELTLTILEKPRKLELTGESTYTVGEEDGYLHQVIAETTLTALLSHFQNPESVKVFDAKGNEITSGTAFIGTGCVVSLMDGDEAVDSLTVVVLGDVDGDGEILAFDYVAVRFDLMNAPPLTGAYERAADADHDGEVLAFDYVAIRRHLMGKTNIYDN